MKKTLKRELISLSRERDTYSLGFLARVQVLSLHFRTYILALERLQMDLATKKDLIGVDESRNLAAGLFSRGRDLKNRSAVFSLGDRINLLKVGPSPPPTLYGMVA